MPMKSSTTDRPCAAPSCAWFHSAPQLNMMMRKSQKRSVLVWSKSRGVDRWKWHPRRNSRIHVDGERRKERMCNWYSTADNYRTPRSIHDGTTNMR